ncbi:3-oxoacyl-[acyl-carrier-protein] synthase II [Candidatus Planktophila dulcis]|uniref:3-oxoacyl-[acyl-carrier-protein] synthase 2 n=1 Tax=Candidatus Planktophila dulcis TaxID=1884914 RepID=A0AAC9YUI1_9ACTN|nr:beta-ketoacyl-ACP synthase II [Candidatus Planktophila dulcis]ASY11758.1 3-oxoacyl-[acyl-carrier-protein] synthase II [Candidatus Planktophila dulcis]ASY14346.1 3-oxoacyl-[acyl-carrier-protein] synthase II [Candidatus Planktophila dulcis]ASY21007.1 3-oxoacyl-[acyl-carrier-protein] synthase II [Candidatus Planktophila dulcis]
MSQRRVVVTGLGATTPLGGDVDSTWKALLAGQSGVRLLTEDWRELLPVHFAARVATEPADQMERVEMRRLDRSEQFALVASREAWKDAGSPDEVDKERLGVVIASGIGGVITLLDQFVNLNEKGARAVSPHTVPMLMPNGPAANVGLELQAKAGVHTPVSACASGAEAIGYAFEMIKNNRADIIVTGGVEAAIHQLPMAGFAAMKALSTRNDAPARASRPYDVDRDGFVLGEGGGILVIEEYEHAKARGAKIYCEIGGQGLSSDGYHIAAPDPDGSGVQRAIKFALENSGLSTKDIVHLNAHATSTPAGDVAEANALRKALGADADHVAVSATKSMTGHLLGGAGAIESVFIVKALQDRLAPPTINIENLDPAVTVDVVRDTPRQLPAGDIAALNDSFGFGGHNVVLAFKSL